MNPNLQEHISKLLNEQILSSHSVSGGDISESYKIITSKNCYFLKTNQSPNALLMFQAEAFGLQLIQNSNTIKTPAVLFCNTFKEYSFLILEYIESKSPSSLDFKNLGIKLAELHQTSAETFGLEQSNFIGSLNQSNTLNASWADFYIQERLLPQLQLAKKNGLLSESECPTENSIIEKLQELCFNVKPSLLHGDLWSGNYLISKSGLPYLIDPAIYYGHHEVDIAMSKLFGGFGDDFYKAYYNVFPPELNTASRIEIYQLYYLLVHLNLFGKSYYSSVKGILKKHF